MNRLLLPPDAFVTQISQSTVHGLSSFRGTDSGSDINSPSGLEPSQAIITDLQQIDHVTKVLGAKAGDTLKIAQLDGNLGSAVIDKIGSTKISLSDVKLDTAPPEKLGLTVILALPRPKVLRRLIMDMTALGVDHIILLNSYRSEKSYWQSPMLERLDEFVIEGLQQAGDTIRPQISLKKRFKPFVEDELEQYLGAFGAIVAHPYAAMSFDDYIYANSSKSNTQFKGPKDANKSQSEDEVDTRKALLPSLLCIGAEGGWIDYEITLLAQHGCTPVSLGDRILRTEAAVNVMIGQWLIHSNSQRSHKNLNR